MKQITITLIALTFIIAVVAVAANTSAQEPPAISDRVRTDQWEYLVVAGAANVSLNSSSSSRMRKDASGFTREAFVLEQQMDQLGAKGWELVSVAGTASDPAYYFKRRK
jgi:uncharacterized protein YpmS